MDGWITAPSILEKLLRNDGKAGYCFRGIPVDHALVSIRWKLSVAGGKK